MENGKDKREIENTETDKHSTWNCVNAFKNQGFTVPNNDEHWGG